MYVQCLLQVVIDSDMSKNAASFTTRSHCASPFHGLAAGARPDRNPDDLPDGRRSAAAGAERRRRPTAGSMYSPART